MGNFELIDTGKLTEKQARLNMEKCAEFLARMIQKYGDSVLREIEERNVTYIPVFLRQCRWMDTVWKHRQKSFGSMQSIRTWKWSGNTVMRADPE